MIRDGRNFCGACQRKRMGRDAPTPLGVGGGVEGEEDEEFHRNEVEILTTENAEIERLED
jgi:hypothetical protein